jgi:pimeloyl-ACP methyl ester carboxylesterase
MKSHTIKGGGGIQLHAVETGNAAGRPILFIHGISQCSLTWIRQLDSALARDYRLIAMDLRGHGSSEKPREGYANSRLWADDVRAVIKDLNLDHPVLCGWSYGPLVILDYLRHYGEDDIRAINLIGGVTKLGSDEATSVLTPDFLKLVPGFFSADAEESALSLGSLISLCHAEKLSAQDWYRMLGYNLSVPAYVRQGMFSRAFDNDDLLPRLQKPALITHGIDDKVVKSTVIDQQMSRIGSVNVRMMATGHACFWDDAPGYNKSLAQFVAHL